MDGKDAERAGSWVVRLLSALLPDGWHYTPPEASPADPGGAGIGRIGPVGEGLVIWVVGVGALMFGIFWMGSKA